MKKKVMIINGSNLDMLGKRDANNYGVMTLDSINQMLYDNFKDYFDLDFFQSNCEGEIINYLHKGFDYDAVVINPGGYTHTSVSIRDALEMLNCIKIEVHLSNINEREEFRKINYIKDMCDKSFVGFKHMSYYKALEYLQKCFNML